MIIMLLTIWTLMLLSFQEKPYAMACSNQKENLQTDCVTMTIDVQKLQKKEYVLDIELTNVSRKVLTIYKHDLPWESLYKLLLVVAEANRYGTVLEREKGIRCDLSLATKVTLRQGKTLRGEVSLNKRFPSLTQAIYKSDLIVFWSYVLETADGSAAQRFGGWLFIPKATPKKD